MISYLTITARVSEEAFQAKTKATQLKNPKGHALIWQKTIGHFTSLSCLHSFLTVTVAMKRLLYGCYTDLTGLPQTMTQGGGVGKQVYSKSLQTMIHDLVFHVAMQEISLSFCGHGWFDLCILISQSHTHTHIDFSICNRCAASPMAATESICAIRAWLGSPIETST